MIFDFIEFRTIALIGHFFGLALGAGGAFASDLMFLSTVKDQKISETEMRFLRLGSSMVWIGLFILVVSGIGLFLTKPDVYLASSKFLAKMTIVGVIIANGLFFHFMHLPRLERHVGSHFPSSDEFMRKSFLLVVSGAVSMVSWASALILGAFKKVPFSYGEIMLFYAIVLACAVLVALFAKRYVFPKDGKRS